MNRYFLQLAHNYNPDKHGIAGWFMSEKLDGVRAFWDGGATRGLLASQVPFANHDRKSHLLEAPRATGLWSRYGNVIHAPAWWLDRLPGGLCLDGELYMGRNSFQRTTSVIKEHTGGQGWLDVRYMVFDSPLPQDVLADGKVNDVNYKKMFCGFWKQMQDLFAGHCAVPVRRSFEVIYSWLHRDLDQNSVVCLHTQLTTSSTTREAQEELADLLNEVTDQGGEGVVLRKASSVWTPKRTYDLLKVKKLHDAEATVIGCTFGRQTEKGSKLLGMLGALLCKLDNGTEFELSGFTDAERELTMDGRNDMATHYACEHPGERAPSWIYAKQFPIGSRVTFRYRELTDGGCPKEARYWRRAQ